ncbi:MAG: DNA gyrase subunit A [Candidatus Eremiobacteraeota bacterium]|nr:DNA gyrase subunit A [Candidatus Eremiobacteraeota bacterium]MBV8222578.1 DNA gyrase subunit A [Candidatus Eremiobacteraeota bacterium]
MSFEEYRHTAPSDRVLTVNVEDEMRTSYLDYAMSVIVARALPDVRDGLKPVHRRILYGMSQLGLNPDKPHRKSAGTVGEVLKNYHPHGDVSIYDAMVRMAQTFSLRYPLIDGHGNFGSIDGDPPAAMRYTESRLGQLALEMLADIDRETVDFVPNYDSSAREPSLLPARLPNLLVNGSSGIAVGMATNIPPHNLTEICDAAVALIDDRELDDDDLLKIVTGPDFPTGALILGREGIKQSYMTGRGSITLRAKHDFEELRGGRQAIIITEIPYQVNKSRLLESIAEVVTLKKSAGIADLRDESDRKGMRIVIELRREASAQLVLNQLYKHTPLQTSFGVNNVALVDGQPRTLSLREMVVAYVEHRKVVVTRRAQYDLRKAKERAHILEGYRIALEHLDAVIKLIRASQTTEEARTGLMKKFELTEIQANAILDLRLQRLVALERQKIEDEYVQLLKTIAGLEELLRSQRRIYGAVKEEIVALKKKFGDKRRTQIVEAEGEFAIEDLIPDQPVVITATAGGYIKRQNVDVFRAQNRGGRGISGLALKKEDVVRFLFSTSTHQHILFFSNRGRVYRLRAHEIPDASRQARGTALVNLLTLPPGETITAVLPVRKLKTEEFLVMVTKKGFIKKTSLNEFGNVRRSGLIAINLMPGDELLSVALTNGKAELLLATTGGFAIRFDESKVRPMGRASRGVRAVRLGARDLVRAMDVVSKDRREVLVITTKGYGKRTKIDAYRKTNRGGKGVKAFSKTAKNGDIVEQLLVKPDDEVMVISTKGVVIRTKVFQIRETGRAAQGVRVMKLDEGDVVTGAANIGQRTEEMERL